MTISLDEADKMIGKAAEKQRLLMVALPHRYRKHAAVQGTDRIGQVWPAVHARRNDG